ncbi:hypothetical protein K2P47_00485 [Patescibacteria group bacterium]|nr:hypothetical protein [Patescibacteria group bacterium]
MDNSLVDCRVKIPRSLLDRLPTMTSANPKVKTAEDHLAEAVRMYILLHAAHNDGKSLYIGENILNLEKLNLFA